jgi:hypothetical protein
MGIILQRIDSSPMSSFHLISYHKRYLFHINISSMSTYCISVTTISKQLTVLDYITGKGKHTFYENNQFTWNIFLREKWNWKCNMEKFWTSLEIHNISTRYRYNLHMPSTNLSKYWKGAYCTRIKLLNNFLPTIKSFNHDMKLFTPASKSTSYLTPFTLSNNLP